MKAMLWKEWRENAKWAVLGLLAFGLATAYMVSQNSIDYNYYNASILSRVTPLTTFLAPLLATVLGLLQVASELRRDQWAFLVHRPVSRSTIFLGKAVAGVTLYLLAMSLPMLLLGLWLATPGNVPAPFTWGMMLPLIADILAGVAFYFAGMLTALRPARWYGSRALGIAAVIICVMLVAQVSEFWQALGVIALSIAVLGTAAWGSFLTTGTYERQPQIAKVALGSTLYLGSAVAVCLICLFLLGIFNYFWSGTNSNDYVYSTYGIDRSGRILRLTYEGAWVKSAVDLQGKPVAQPASRRDFEKLTDYSLVSPREQPSYNTYRSFDRYFIPMGTSQYNTTWYYDRAANRAVGYSLKDKKVIGFLGPTGYTPVRGNDMRSGAVSAASFEGPVRMQNSWRMPSIYIFPRSVYRIDVNNRRVVPIDSLTGPGRIRGATALNIHYEGREDADSVIAVVVGDQARFFTRNGKALFSTPLEYQDQGYGNVAISVMPAGARYFLWYYPPPQASSGIDRKPSYISEVSRRGEVLARHTLPPLPSTIRLPRWQEYWPSVAVPPLLVAGFVTYGAVGSKLNAPGAGALWTEMRHSPENSLVIIMALLAGVASLLCAVLALFVARRCAMSRRTQWSWALGVFALGAFGLLMMLAMLGWPARVDCPSCHRKRVVERDNCEHCGASFPEPVQDGTEIFSDYQEGNESSNRMRLAS